MTREDERIKRLYTEAFDNIHASDELRRKVIKMTENTSKEKKNISKIRKIAFVAAAAAILVVGGGMIAAHAVRGAYKDETVSRVMFNGEEKEAYFHDFGTGVGSWRFYEDDMEYSVFMHGNIDIDTTVYVVDMGSYVMASDVPEPTLNLYTDMEKSPFVEISDDGYMIIKTNLDTDRPMTERILWTLDAEDGTEDGIAGLGIDDVVSTYTIMSDGTVAETFKQDVSGINGIVKYFLKKSVDNYVDEDEDPYTYGMEDIVETNDY